MSKFMLAGVLALATAGFGGAVPDQSRSVTHAANLPEYGQPARPADGTARGYDNFKDAKYEADLAYKNGFWEWYDIQPDGTGGYQTLFWNKK